MLSEKLLPYYEAIKLKNQLICLLDSSAKKKMERYVEYAHRNTLCLDSVFNQSDMNVLKLLIWLQLVQNGAFPPYIHISLLCLSNISGILRDPLGNWWNRMPGYGFFAETRHRCHHEWSQTSAAMDLICFHVSTWKHLQQYYIYILHYNNILFPTV